jgi:two-component system, cell cycle response regulator DivK
MPQILLVEDNEMNRDMLSRRLIRKGFEVVMAIDGTECMQTLAEHNPDIILMDINLPGRDGYELTQEVK